ncbi:MAG: nSTAND1 domain-containing NTPase, partial [Candidatus Limnocylindrales bacterium]
MTDERAGRTDLPTGTVTFLRTDVEGSMGLARQLGGRWDEVNATHLGIIRRAVDAHGGVCVRTEGDAFFGVFPEAGAAVVAAIDAQRALTAHEWPADGTVRVRMGLHSGEAHLAGDDYGGFEVNRAARIAAAGHGGQIVLSEPTRLLAEAALINGVSVRDLGRHVLKDVPVPEHLFQLDVPGLHTDFPPLRTVRPSAGNLPLRMTSFLGRDRELEELRVLLAANRLVTLTGPGGIGKTSLAVELARASGDTIPDGSWFVALDAIPDASLVSATIARAFGLYDSPDRPAFEGLTRYLADRSTLLVIDNFEHVISAAGEI